MSVKSDKLSTRSAEADPWATPLREPTNEEKCHAARIIAGRAKNTEDALHLLRSLGLAAWLRERK